LIAAFCESATSMKTTGMVEPCDTPLTESTCTAVAGCAWNTQANKPLRVWLECGGSDKRRRLVTVVALVTSSLQRAHGASLDDARYR